MRKQLYVLESRVSISYANMTIYVTLRHVINNEPDGSASTEQKAGDR